MITDFESKTSSQGLTFKLYRGEGAALLAFDLAQDLAPPAFVGFSIEVRYPGANHWGAGQAPAFFQPAAQQSADCAARGQGHTCARRLHQFRPARPVYSGQQRAAVRR